MNYYYLESLKDYFSDQNLSIENKQSISGGSINQVSRLDLSNGQQVLLKEYRQKSSAPFFKPEFDGLTELLHTVKNRTVKKLEKNKSINKIIIPKPLGYYFEEDYHYLIIEYFQPCQPSHHDWYDFGSQLAEFHLMKLEMKGGDQYGFSKDNILGSAPQKNSWKNNWREFFKVNRLKFQIDWAEENGFKIISQDKVNSTLDHIVERLPEFPSPCLLHGDLWSGNSFFTQLENEVRGVMIDPAVYYGDAETDLAMTKLFGGYPSEFYQGYHSVIPIRSGLDERIEIYNLYHQLNHLNLFGSGYLSGVKNTLRKYS